MLAGEVTPQIAAQELLRRRRARSSLVDYARYIDVPGAPVSEDEEVEQFEPVETVLAEHHETILNATQRCIERHRGRTMLFLPPGSAKALALDTPIPTPTGWKAMGDLVEGDQVLDENGKPCNVTWVSPVWRNRPVYEVKTDCGDKIIADRDHEWLVTLCRKNPVAEIKETHELCRRRAKRPMITRAKALELPEAELPIEPYLLGLWLGDGSKASPRITAHVDDQPFYRSELAEVGVEARSTSVDTLFQVIGLRGAMVSLGLLNDKWHNAHGRKHIPSLYLRASRRQRMELLQGLIDTDGTVCKDRGCSTFCSTNRELAENVRELVRSLGVKAGWSVSRAVQNGKDHGEVYRVSFYLDGSARLPRKAELTRDQYRTPNTYIDVSPAGFADTVCIEVDSPSHLFLCGRSMTPTHNSTYATVVAPTWAMGRKNGFKVIAVSYGTDLARKFGRRMRSIVKQSAYARLFGTSLSAESSAAHEWALENGSEFMGGGILSGITGNRADFIAVDDPIKGRQEADSEAVRKSTVDAYQEDVLTRLKPGGSLMITQTRWHEGDLAGSILPEGWAGESGMIECRDGETWEVICIPAKATRSDDPLGRLPGEYIWPEWFGEGHWAPFERMPRTWSALYQQVPSPDTGDYFKREWIVPVEHIPPKEEMAIYGGSDYAVTADGGDYTVHAVVGVSHDGRMYLLDLWRQQASSDMWVDSFCSMVRRWKPIGWAEEGGQIKSGVGPFLVKRMLETASYVVREQFPTRGDKAVRAQSIRGRMAMQGLHVPKDAPWLPDFISELMSFPVGVHDDQVDAIGLVGQLLDRTEHGNKPKSVNGARSPVVLQDGIVAPPLKGRRK